MNGFDGVEMERCFRFNRLRGKNIFRPVVNGISSECPCGTVPSLGAPKWRKMRHLLKAVRIDVMGAHSLASTFDMGGTLVGTWLEVFGDGSSGLSGSL